MTVRILRGDCMDVLKGLPDESVHTCVTSPPYFGLRDYGVDGQIGLEDSPQAFVTTMVAVFEEVRRVLRSDGTCWLNIGDSYAGSWGAQSRPQGPSGEMASRSVISARQIRAHPRFDGKTGTVGAEWGLKPKDLMLVPFRLALALQAAGWWVRQDIIWAKPNPMPESILDRCTKAHEYLFLLAKSERYHYDADAIRETRTSDEDAAEFRGGCYVGGNIDNSNGGKRAVTGNKRVKVPGGWDRGDGAHGTIHRDGRTSAEYQEVAVKKGRNKRSVWTVATHAFPDAHFATFPPALIEPCILAGCPVGGTVLDPFGGAGTTGLVADRHGRNAILIELNPEYAAMAEKRIRGDAPLFADVA